MYHVKMISMIKLWIFKETEPLDVSKEELIFKDIYNFNIKNIQKQRTLSFKKSEGPITFMKVKLQQRS